MFGEELCRNTSQFLWYLQQRMWPSLCTYENKSSGKSVWWITLIWIIYIQVYSDSTHFANFMPSQTKCKREKIAKNQQEVNILTSFSSSTMEIKFVTPLGYDDEKSRKIGLLWFTKESCFHIYLNIPNYLNNRHPYISTDTPWDTLMNSYALNTILLPLPFSSSVRRRTSLGPPSTAETR